jgi:cytochrome c556
VRATYLAGVLLVLAASALGADGKAVYEHRLDTMKQMGRALYVTVSRVAKGRTEFGPDTVTAAETIARLAPSIGTLFPPGSDVPGSNMKPEIFGAPDKVTQFAAGVQAAMPGFVANVKSGDKARIADAYAEMSKACDACHNEFRREE